MLTKQDYTTPQNKQPEKNSLSLRINPKPSSDSPVKKKSLHYNFVKRLSPFLITVILLPFFTIFTVINNVHLFEKMWLQVIVFCIIEFNLLLLDYALWNYFCGKKVVRIWMIELTF